MTSGAFQQNPDPAKGNLVICKIGPDGTMLACSYLGKDAVKDIEGISADKAGNVYVTGTTRDPNFPTAGSPFQRTYQADGEIAKEHYEGNGFLTIIASDFKRLRYSTFMGRQCSISGKNAFGGFHVNALAPDGSVIVAGSWHSAGFPTTNAFHAIYYGGPMEPPWAASDAVLARFVPGQSGPGVR